MEFSNLDIFRIDMKNEKEIPYLQNIKLALKSKPHCWNMIEAINILPVYVVKYSGGILN